jgi:phosphate-selective porin
MAVLLATLLLAQNPPPAPPADDALRFRSEDGSFEAIFSGFLRIHGRTIFDRPDDDVAPLRTLPDGVFIRQARVETQGVYLNDWAYRLQMDLRTGLPDFSTAAPASQSTTALRDAWLEWRRFPELSVRIGQFYEPCAAEDFSSTRNAEFGDRPPIHRLMPGREIGIELLGSVLDGTLRYFAMLSNGGGLVNDLGRGVADTDDGKELSGIVFVNPFPFLRLGAGGSVADVDTQPGTAFDLYTTELSVLWLDSTAGTFDGRRTRVDLSLLAHAGPVSLRAEYLRRQDELEGGPESRLDSDGWTLSASWLATGEDKRPDRRPEPASDWGAVEFAARVSRARVPDAFEAGLAGPGNSEGVTAATVAAVWWLGRHIRLSADLIREAFDDRLDFDGRRESSLTGLLARAQLDF